MLTTTKLGLKKPETADARSVLRTAISDNADTLETIFGKYGSASVAANQSTASAGPLDLTTVGPTVTLVLPSAALVVIHATAKLESSASGVMRVYVDVNGTNAGQILEGSAGAGVTAYKATAPGSTTGLTDNTLGGVGAGLGGGFLVRPYAAGTYAFKLRYGSTGGTVWAAERNLFVRALVF